MSVTKAWASEPILYLRKDIPNVFFTVDRKDFLRYLICLAPKNQKGSREPSAKSATGFFFRYPRGFCRERSSVMRGDVAFSICVSAFHAQTVL